MAGRRRSVIVMSELIALNLRACNAGIRPSNEFSTHTHFAFSFAHDGIADVDVESPAVRPTATSIRTAHTSASTPKRTSLMSAAEADAAVSVAVANSASAAVLRQFIFHYGCSSTVLNRTEPNPDRHDCRAKNAIQTRAAAAVQRSSREAGIVQARLPRLRGAGVKAASRARGSAEELKAAS